MSCWCSIQVLLISFFLHKYRPIHTLSVTGLCLWLYMSVHTCPFVSLSSRENTLFSPVTLMSVPWWFKTITVNPEMLVELSRGWREEQIDIFMYMYRTQRPVNTKLNVNCFCWAIIERHPAPRTCCRSCDHGDFESIGSYFFSRSLKQMSGRGRGCF